MVVERLPPATIRADTATETEERLPPGRPAGAARASRNLFPEDVEEDIEEMETEAEPEGPELTSVFQVTAQKVKSRILVLC